MPDDKLFKPLQEAARLILYKGYSPSEAVQHLNEKGVRTRKGEKWDLSHYVATMRNTFYAGKINIGTEGWPEDVKGLHEPMLSEPEHKQLVAILSKRNPRVRIKHNPEFPLANLMRHYECVGCGGYEKLAGFNFNPGKRPSGRQRELRPVYRCRDCQKKLSRQTVHDALKRHLDELRFLPSDDQFKRALRKVYRDKQGSMVQRMNALGTRKGELETLRRNATEEYVKETNPIIKESIKGLIASYDSDVNDLLVEINSLKHIDTEAEDFIAFSIDTICNMRDEWWNLSYENRARGEQILFNGKLYVDSSATVHTPKLNSILRLGTNKKDLQEASFTKLVELPGTAPGSEK